MTGALTLRETSQSVYIYSCLRASVLSAKLQVIYWDCWWIWVLLGELTLGLVFTSDLVGDQSSVLPHLPRSG
jgi:hypothetical protein